MGTNMSICGWGTYTHILGHRSEVIVEAVEKQLKEGIHWGLAFEKQVEWAELIREMIPCAEMVRFCCSGTEATMYAIRLARSFTGRPKILKFEGHYHGHHDYVLFSVESPSTVAGLETAPAKLAFYPGIPEDIAHTVIVAPWNNLLHIPQSIPGLPTLLNL
jgi:glutamate-1-semialdehyde 2,1-aminomutase